MLDLAQRDIGENSIANLIYSKGDLEIYPQGTLSKILPVHLEEMIKESGSPDELNNLNFSISQDSPVRRVYLHIGSGDWTTYRVESNDQTWAFGRYHELTEKLLSDRNSYAKVRSAKPEVPQEQSDTKWRPAPWEPVAGWWFFLIGVTTTLLKWLPVILGVTAAFEVGNYYAAGKAAQYRQERANDLATIHWAGAHRGALIGFSISYIIALIAFRRWLSTLVKSKVVLNKGSLLSRFSFRDKRADPVILASFYVAIATLIFTAMAVLIG
jgi:hypothetical protein